VSEQLPFYERHELLEPRSRVLIFAGPNGAGKDTLEALFTEKEPEAQRIVRYITRPPATSEVDGRDYYFIDDETFNVMIAEGEFVEHATYPGSKSGTSYAEVGEKLQAALFATLTANFEDGFLLHQRLQEIQVASHCFFIAPYSEEEMIMNPEHYITVLRERMSNRGRGTDHIEGRLVMAMRYRDQYLQVRDRVLFIDNSQDQMAEAHRMISRHLQQ
jgi:guanylate kinase